MRESKNLILIRPAAGRSLRFAVSMRGDGFGFNRVRLPPLVAKNRQKPSRACVNEAKMLGSPCRRSLTGQLECLTSDSDTVDRCSYWATLLGVPPLLLSITCRAFDGLPLDSLTVLMMEKLNNYTL